MSHHASSKPTAFRDHAVSRHRNAANIRVGDFGSNFTTASLSFGPAYAVWTGIGALGPARVVCLTLIVVGMVGLKLNSPV